MYIESLCFSYILCIVPSRKDKKQPFILLGFDVWSWYFTEVLENIQQLT